MPRSIELLKQRMHFNDLGLQTGLLESKKTRRVRLAKGSLAPVRPSAPQREEEKIWRDLEEVRRQAAKPTPATHSIWTELKAGECIRRANYLKHP